MTRHFSLGEGSYGGADIFNYSRMSAEHHHVVSEQAKSVPHGVAGAPNEAVLLQLMERTGYTMLQENGQRKYGGPPPVWEGPAPLRGCEVFVGKIPRDCYEDELVPVFEKVSRIYELRLMMDFSGSNRGYCFVMYTCKEDARRAVKDLNNFEIRKGRFLGVCLSVDNCRLFVGGIPKNKQRDEILGEMVKVTEGVVDVIVYPSATDKSKNRGFAFVEFESHKAAAMARRKLIPGRIQLWGHPIAVDWAEPEQEVDEDIMCKVKILYVRNLMLSTTEDTIREVFTKAVEKPNCVERVKKIRDYAFVHLREREDALKALKVMDGKLIDSSQVEVCLAKPVDKTEYVRFSRGGGNRGGYSGVCMSTTDAELKTGEALLEGYGSMAYGDQQAAFPYYQQMGMANASAALGGRGFAGRPQVSPLSPGAQMGGSPRGRGRGAAGMRGTGGRSYLSGVRNTNYRKRATDEPRLYDLTPDMVLTPTNPLTLKPQSVTSYVQVLEDMCQKNGWGQPMYQLNSTLGQDANGDMQLFLYKVSVPALPGLHQTNKLCRTVDEAKQFAAENVLRQLNIPMDAGGDGSTMALANGQASAYGQLAAAASVGRTPTTLYSMSNASLSSAISSYPSTLASVPLTSSYVMSPQRTPHTMTQLNGHGDMTGFDAFNFSALAAAPMGYAPQYHP